MTKSQETITCKGGCIAEDTLIKMSDSTTKKIQDLNEGDKIYGFEGNALEVKSIYSGSEEVLMTMRTNKERTIKMTVDHPIKAETGIIPMSKVRLGMNVVVENNELEQIVMISENSYNTKVYNLNLRVDLDDNQRLIIANGFMVGDYNLQLNMGRFR